MQIDQQAAGVVAFYDAHPINEEQILHTLAANGIALEGLTETVLHNHDQDHFGGVASQRYPGCQSRHRRASRRARRVQRNGRPCALPRAARSGVEWSAWTSPRAVTWAPSA